MGEASDRGGQTAETGMLKGSREPRAPPPSPAVRRRGQAHSSSLPPPPGLRRATARREAVAFSCGGGGLLRHPRQRAGAGLPLSGAAPCLSRALAKPAPAGAQGVL